MVFQKFEYLTLQNVFKPSVNADIPLTIAVAKDVLVVAG
jgi:hypothetical protein